MRHVPSKSPMKVPVTIIPGVVPQGVERFYSVQAISQMPGNMGTMQGETNAVKKVIFSEDGKTVWFQNINYGVPGDYIMGTVEGDRIVCQFPQQYIHQHQKDSQGNEADVYFNAMALDYNVEPGRDEMGNIVNFYTFTISDEQTVEFQYDAASGQITELSTLGIGTVVVMYDDDDNEAPQFIGYADVDFDMTWEKDFYVPQVPEDLTFENYLLEYQNEWGRDKRNYVDAAIADGHVYIKGMSMFREEAVVCLDSAEDGSYVLPMGEYLGYDAGMNLVAFTGRNADNVDGFEATEGMAFRVDADAKTIDFDDPEAFFAYNTSLNELYYLDYFSVPMMTQCEQPAFAVPTPPYDFMYFDQYWDWGLGNQLIFYVNPVSTEGELLSTSRLYFQFFIDDMPWTLYPDEYRNLLEPMDLVPFDFSDGRDINDFSSKGQWYDICFYVQDFESIGIQIWYENIDGSMSGSDIMRVTVGDSGVSAIGASALNDAECFDLSGHRISNPGKGIYVIRTPDGAVRKIMK